MSAPGLSRSAALRLCLFGAAWTCAGVLHGQVAAPGASGLPAIAPTNAIAPLAATAPSQSTVRRHRADVRCTGGTLEVRADNSSLNSILRSISQCTGMRITGGLTDQRVFGTYGPAAPATVLATLLDGTGANMLLRETASDQPAELILTPRTGGPTPPSPSAVHDEDADLANEAPPSGPSANGQFIGNGNPNGIAGQLPNGQPGNQTPVPQPQRGSAVTGPVSIPQPINNVNGSASNTSPTVSSYPTTNSVPLDTLPTPSTSGIVDAPNPPAPGSDTANLLNGSTATAPGTTTIVDGPTNTSTQPGATNTATPVPTGSIQPGADTAAAPTAGTPTNGTPATGALTPQQVFQQLQQLRQQQQQQQSPTTPSPQ